MEDKQKVYIKGNPNRGTEVIKTLTDLGAINLNNLDGKGENTYYYISPLGIIIGVANYEENMMSILKEFYKEIKIPKREELLDGTLLVRTVGGKKEYFVYSEKDSVINGELTSYINVDDNGYEVKLTSGNCRSYKVATKDDIKCFQELLHKYGKEWSFIYKILVDWKWNPENNEEYWYINDVGDISNTLFDNFFYCDIKRVKVGNCFQTKTAAINMRNKIVKILCGK